MHRIGGKFKRSSPWTTLVGRGLAAQGGIYFEGFVDDANAIVEKVQIRNSNYVWNMNIKAVSYPEKETLRSRLLTMHGPTSSIYVQVRHTT